MPFAVLQQGKVVLFVCQDTAVAARTLPWSSTLASGPNPGKYCISLHLPFKIKNFGKWENVGIQRDLQVTGFVRYHLEIWT